MVFFLLLPALAGAYLVSYTVHCFAARNVRAAIGALLLILGLAALTTAFVSVMLQNA